MANATGATPLPAAAHIGAVSLRVADLERSLRFYRDSLGLRIQQSSPGIARLGDAGGSEVLLELVEVPGVRPVPRRGLLGLYHFALLLPTRGDLGRFVRHLNAAGIRYGASDHLFSEALYLVDPDGLTLEVYADRPRTSWQYRGGELVSATLPLDEDAVTKEAGPEPWTGFPDGTTVGHVHLYVGDLQESNAFYRQALGFEPTVTSYPGALFLSAGGYHHHIGLNTWAADSPPATLTDAGLRHWELILPTAADTRAVTDRLRSAGYPVSIERSGITSNDPWDIAVVIKGENQ